MSRYDAAHSLKLVILGRDGTLNFYRDDHVKAPEELVPLPGALDAVARLNHGGWHTVLATNQPGIGRGLLDMASLNAVHSYLNQLLAEKGGRIDAAFFCPHTAEDGCDCRKPLPGLITQIAQRFGIDNSAHMHVVGASLGDLQTAHAAGCQPHLVCTGQLGALPEAEMAALVALVPGTLVHKDLSAFADHLLLAERRARADARGEAMSQLTEHGELN